MLFHFHTPLSNKHPHILTHTLKTLCPQPAPVFWGVLACTQDWWKLLPEHLFLLIPLKKSVHSGDIWSELGKLMKQLINWNSSHQSPEPSAASFTFQTISWWPNRTLSINTHWVNAILPHRHQLLLMSNDTFNPCLIKLHIWGFPCQFNVSYEFLI